MARQELSCDIFALAFPPWFPLQVEPQRDQCGRSLLQLNVCTSPLICKGWLLLHSMQNDPAGKESSWPQGKLPLPSDFLIRKSDPHLFR